MTVSKLPNGNLAMKADRFCRHRIKQLIKFFGGSTYAAEAGFLADELQCRNQAGLPKMQQTAPCSVGALTDAPCITNGSEVWGFMDYQVESFLELLADGKTAVWVKG